MQYWEDVPHWVIVKYREPMKCFSMICVLLQMTSPSKKHSSVILGDFNYPDIYCKSTKIRTANKLPPPNFLAGFISQKVKERTRTIEVCYPRLNRYQQGWIG